jgi:hypothetical protein
MLKKPILVTGSHRSGTTWVGNTISQHRRIRYVQEPFNVNDPNAQTGLELDNWFTHFNSSDRQQDIICAFDELLEHAPIRYAKNVVKNANPDIKMPLRFAKHLLLETFVTDTVLIKDPLALLSADWLHENYGSSNIVMIRKPEAFVGSLKAAGWDFNFEDLKRQKHLMNGRLSEFGDAIEEITAGRSKSDFVDRASLLWTVLHTVIDQYRNEYPEWMYVKHEELASNPQAGFSNIFRYLNLEEDTSIKDYIEAMTKNLTAPEADDIGYRARNSALVIDNWKRRLSARELERIREYTSALSAKFYDT